MTKRDFYQRRFYASHRASLAVDRLIRAQTPDEKIRAGRWAQLWGFFAQLPAARRK
jgi:hypothetical protein